MYWINKNPLQRSNVIWERCLLRTARALDAGKFIGEPLVSEAESSHRILEWCKNFANRQGFRIFLSPTYPGSIPAGYFLHEGYKFQWDGSNMYIDYHSREKNLSVVVLHEVTHWIVSTPQRRKKPEYGLGSGPGTYAIKAADRAQRMSNASSYREEVQVCLLAGLIAESLGVSPFSSWEFTNVVFKTGRCLESTTRGAFEKDCEQAVVLWKRGLIDRNGKFRIKGVR